MSAPWLARLWSGSYYPFVAMSEGKPAALRDHAIDVDGRAVFYREARPLSSPEGDILLLHGWIGASSWMFHYLLPELGRRYRTLAPDLPGFGRSEPLSRRPSIAHYGQFVRQFADRLDVDRFHLVGVSVGGTLALHFAHRYPERVGKLILQGPVYRGEDLPQRFRILYRLLGRPPLFDLVPKAPLKWWFFIRRLDFSRDTRHLSAEDRRRLARDIPRISNQALIQVGRELITLDLSEEARRLCVPTLILDGEEARLVPAAASRRLHALIPRSQLHIVPDAGHNLALEKPQEFLQQLLAFLDSDA